MKPRFDCRDVKLLSICFTFQTKILFSGGFRYFLVKYWSLVLFVNKDFSFVVNGILNNCNLLGKNCFLYFQFAYRISILSLCSSELTMGNFTSKPTSFLGWGDERPWKRGWPLAWKCNTGKRLTDYALSVSKARFIHRISVASNVI